MSKDLFFTNLGHSLDPADLKEAESSFPAEPTEQPLLKIPSPLDDEESFRAPKDLSRRATGERGAACVGSKRCMDAQDLSSSSSSSSLSSRKEGQPIKGQFAFAIKLLAFFSLLFVGILLVLSMLATLTLAINNYTHGSNQTDRVDELAIQIQSLEASFKQVNFPANGGNDLEELNSTSNELDALTGAVIVLRSRLSLLEESSQSQLSINDRMISRMSDFEHSVNESQRDMKEALFNKTNAALEMLQFQVTQNLVLSRQTARDVAALSAQLNSTADRVRSLASEMSQLQSDVEAITTQLNNNITSLAQTQKSASQALDSAKRTLGDVRASFGRISMAFVDLNSTLASPLSLYGSCFRDVVNCTVRTHPASPFWYRCTTAALRINVPVSVT